jgi:hypothetical protein
MGSFEILDVKTKYLIDNIQRYMYIMNLKLCIYAINKCNNNNFSEYDLAARYYQNKILAD